MKAVVQILVLHFQYYFTAAPLVEILNKCKNYITFNHNILLIKLLIYLYVYLYRYLSIFLTFD